MKGDRPMKKQEKPRFIDREFPPAQSLEQKEEQMVLLSMERAEQQIRDGTASSQVLTHYLKIGSTKEKLEKQILNEQKKLIVAKTEQIESQKKVEELYANAINAFMRYSPSEDDDIDEG